jgi:hypothetical protein
VIRAGWHSFPLCLQPKFDQAESCGAQWQIVWLAAPFSFSVPQFVSRQEEGYLDSFTGSLAGHFYRFPETQWAARPER